MQKRIIKEVAVLGSGVMGSRIACHFAGIGLQVLLLDIAAEGKDPNKIVNDSLSFAIKSNPSPVYTTDVVKRITTGNFTDNMKDISSCDWIIEVVVEKLEVKKIHLDEAIRMVESGQITDSMSIAAIQRVQLLIYQNKIKR